MVTNQSAVNGPTAQANGLHAVFVGGVKGAGSPSTGPRYPPEALSNRLRVDAMWLSSGPGINSGAYPKEVTEIPHDEAGRPVQISSAERPPRPEDKDHDKSGDKR